MRLGRSKPPKKAVVERGWEEPSTGCARLLNMNLNNYVTFLSSNFSFPEIIWCELCLNIEVMCLYHRRNNKTGFNTRAVKRPIFWGIGCWWADEEEADSDELGGPKLCFDPHPDLYWRGCVGLFGAVRVSYSSLHPASAPLPVKAQFVKVNVHFSSADKGEAKLTGSALCAIYNNTSSRCPANQSGRGAEGDQVQVKFPRKSLPRRNF